MAIVDDFDGFLIDLDGVVYVGDELVPGSDIAIESLRARGKDVLFLTNDPRHSREEYAAKLRRLGLDVSPDDILTAGAATAEYIARHEDITERTAYVLGSPALEDEVRAVGLAVVEGEGGRSADFVVVGGHNEVTYDELRIASLAVQHGAEFYATGKDASFPMPDGMWPATGAILAVIETTVGRTAHVIGKPEPEMFEVARALLPKAVRIVVVGDRLDSDVAGGHRAGLATVLVLTGTATEREVADAAPAPDYVVADLKALLSG